MLMCGHLLENKLQIKISLSVFILIFLSPLIGGFSVLLSHDNLLPHTLDGLIYPFDTITLFYAQGTITFHFVSISLLYLLFGVLVYLGYKFILVIIHKIKNKK